MKPPKPMIKPRRVVVYTMLDSRMILLVLLFRYSSSGQTCSVWRGDLKRWARTSTQRLDSERQISKARAMKLFPEAFK